MSSIKELPVSEKEELLTVLKSRFEKNMKRHPDLEWAKIESKLNTSKIWSLNEMEKTGGEPDVIYYDQETDKYTFCDCSPESPIGRRSICFDREGQDSRKEHKPKSNAIDKATEMGVEILTENQYRDLQKLGEFDKKTSSWIATPSNIRKLGGALFGDFRYGTVFIYHNGAQSYYAARGFRGLLKV